jgi:hypothetical protein
LDELPDVARAISGFVRLAHRLAATGEAVLHRAFVVPRGSTIHGLDLRSLGTSWAARRRDAQPFGARKTASDDVLRLTGRVAVDGIDWEESFRWSVSAGIQEIRLLPWTTVQIVAVQRGSGKVTPIHRGPVGNTGPAQDE